MGTVIDGLVADLKTILPGATIGKILDAITNLFSIGDKLEDVIKNIEHLIKGGDGALPIMNGIVYFSFALAGAEAFRVAAESRR